MKNQLDTPSTEKRKTIDKYGIWIIVFGLIVLLFVLKFLLDLVWK
jgi:cytochrome c1